MKSILTVMMHVLGIVVLAAVVIGMMAAPGFLSAGSSVIELSTVARVSSR